MFDATSVEDMFWAHDSVWSFSPRTRNESAYIHIWKTSNVNTTAYTTSYFVNSVWAQELSQACRNNLWHDLSRRRACLEREAPIPNYGLTCLLKVYNCISIVHKLYIHV